MISLNYPEEMKGWIFIGTFHTHDFDSDPSQPTGEKRGLANDVWTVATFSLVFATLHRLESSKIAS